jgi:flagella basal body P-ring formation protein FlgA
MKASSFFTKTNICKLLLPAVLLLSTLSASTSFAQPLEQSLKSQSKEHVVESLDSMVISHIKKEFGRQDLDVFVVLTPKNVLESLNAGSIASVNVHSFNTKKQKCRVTVRTIDSKSLMLEAKYSFSKVIPVVSRNLKSGSLILASDLTWRRCEMPFIHWNQKDLLENKEAIVGRQLTKSIKASRPIYDSLFTNYSQSSQVQSYGGGGTSLSGSFFGSAFGQAGKVIGGVLALMLVGFIFSAVGS